MPGVNDLDAMREILNASPYIRILVVSMLEDDDSAFAAMRAGARGYLPKGANQAEMLAAIRAVANGEAIFGPSIAQRLNNNCAKLIYEYKFRPRLYANLVSPFLRSSPPV